MSLGDALLSASIQRARRAWGDARWTGPGRVWEGALGPALEAEGSAETTGGALEEALTGAAGPVSSKAQRTASVARRSSAIGAPTRAIIEPRPHVARLAEGDERGALRGEGVGAGEQIVEQQGQRMHIALGARAAAGHGLGSAVERGADGLLARRLHAQAFELGVAEIGDLHGVAVGDEDVFGPEIAVEEAVAGNVGHAREHGCHSFDEGGVELFKGPSALPVNGHAQR